MPWTDSWLVKVDDLPDFFYADINHAYITKDNKVYVLSSDRKGWVLLNDGEGANTQLTDTELRQMFEAYKQEVASKEAELNTKLSDIDRQLEELEVKASEPKGIQEVSSNSPFVTTSLVDDRVELDTDLSNLNLLSSSNGITVNKTKDLITLDASSLEKSISDLSGEVEEVKNRPDKDTTYTQELSGNTLTLKGSDGNDSSVQLPEYASKATVEEHNNRIRALEDYVLDQYVIYMCKERPIREDEIVLGIGTHGKNLVYYVTKQDICMLLPKGYNHAVFNGIIINKSTDSNDDVDIVLEEDRILLKLYKGE